MWGESIWMLKFGGKIFHTNDYWAEVDPTDKWTRAVAVILQWFKTERLWLGPKRLLKRWEAAPTVVAWGMGRTCVSGETQGWWLLYLEPWKRGFTAESRWISHKGNTLLLIHTSSVELEGFHLPSTSCSVLMCMTLHFMTMKIMQIEVTSWKLNSKCLLFPVPVPLKVQTVFTRYFQHTVQEDVSTKNECLVLTIVSSQPFTHVK